MTLPTDRKELPPEVAAPQDGSDGEAQHRSDREDGMREQPGSQDRLVGCPLHQHERKTDKHRRESHSG